MKITIAAVGKMKSGATQELLHKYLKRTPWEVTIKEVEEKRSLPSEKLKESEAKLLLATIPSGVKKIILDEHGKTMSSVDFANKLQDWQNYGTSEVAFLIGGADGHGDAVLKSADLTLSFGKMTWPHMMVRAMLGEQIYRAYSILNSHPYHRE